MKKKIKILFILIINVQRIFALTSETYICKNGKEIKNTIIEYYQNGLINKIYNNNELLEIYISDTDKNKFFVKKNSTIISEIEYINDNLLLNDIKSLTNEIYHCKNEKDKLIINNKDSIISISNDYFEFIKNNIHLIFQNQTIYDIASYGEIETSNNIRSTAIIEKENNNICNISINNCFEYNTGGFIYKPTEFADYNFTSELNTTKFLYRFINFYICMKYYEEIDLSVLPIIFCVRNREPAKKQSQIVNIKNDSYLIENTEVYEANNLKTIKNLPWASKNGYGIGDVLTLYIDKKNEVTLNIYNGFQSKEKPYLYEQNSRVKSISITDIDTGEKKDIILEDNPNGQNIFLNSFVTNDIKLLRLEIKINDIYKGSKYKDLCIQAILIK